MIACPLPEVLETPLGDLAFGCDFGWQMLPVPLLAIAGAAFTIAGWMARPWTGRHARPFPFVRLALLLVSATALALSGLAPWYAELDEAQGQRIVVVQDVSDSQRRSDDQMRRAADAIGAWVAPLGEAARDADQAVVDLLLFADGARIGAENGTLAELPDLVRRGVERAEALGIDAGESRIADALEAAGERLAAAEAPGFVVLISDGLETEGDGAEAARELARGGRPVHVLPVESPAPGLGLYSAYLPPQIEAGTITTARLVLVNESDRPSEVSLAWTPSGGADAGTLDRVIPPGTEAAVRIPLAFDRRGLQHVDIRLTAGDVSQTRRLYTQVIAPPRIAVIGPAPWAAALDRGGYDLVRFGPAQPFNPDDVDLIVIDAVAADRLAPDMPGRIADAIEFGGLGLLLVNGMHLAGGDVPVTLASYEHGPLDTFLPVTSQPRMEVVEPPGGNITLIIDVSGSMNGPPLDFGKVIGTYILDQLVARDVASLYSFSDSELLLMEDRAMDADGRRLGARLLGGLQAGGGTNPVGAVTRVAQRARPPCGVFFISDGFFNQNLRQPGCMTTVFAIGNTEQQINPILRQLGEVHAVPLDGTFRIEDLVLGFFNPQPRPRSFEPGEYIPDDLELSGRYLPDPPLPLSGTAVSYARPTADLIAMRPWPLDPVLAFKETGLGEVAVVTTEVPQSWAEAPQGARAIAAWAERLIGWSERDRYQISAKEVDGEIELTLALTSEDGDTLAPPPRIDRLSAELRGSTGRAEAIRFDPDSAFYGTFRAQVPADTAAVESRDGDARGIRRGALTLSEAGPGAIAEEQAIPIELPGDVAATVESGGAEIWSFGLNVDGLRAIAAAGAGNYDLETVPLNLSATRPMAPPKPLWPWLIAVAALAYVTLIAHGRLIK